MRIKKQSLVELLAVPLCGVASLNAFATNGATQPQRSKTKEKSKPNILVLWGDDIGTTNISYNNKGLMGFPTPNIDRIANEGIAFTDYYGQQSCTAGRAAFIGGNNPMRTGMTKVGLPGAPQGWQASDVTMATVLKSEGYATAQFGKNHQGDRDAHLPTMHGFDLFFGNLYHLNAEEEPEDHDYASVSHLISDKLKPRGVISSYLDETGKHIVKETGPLTKKRMETIDDETSDAAIQYIREQVKTGKPFFVWWNGTRMHFRTHVREDRRTPNNDEYTDGMIEHDMHVGKFLALLDELGIADNTLVMYSTDNGPHYNTWPDAANTPFRSEKNSNWEGAYRVPCFVKWPGVFPAGKTLNGIVSHQDWLPTFASAAGNTSIKENLLKGITLNGRTYKNYIDGFDMMDYLRGKTQESPRSGFIYVSDESDITAVRVHDWKIVFKENRGVGFEVWREPYVNLRVPLFFNLRRDPYERAQLNSNTYNDWIISKGYIINLAIEAIFPYLSTFKEFPPSQKSGSWDVDAIKRTLMEAQEQ